LFGCGRALLLAPTRLHSKPHPSSTLRAVAHRCGGGCRSARCCCVALLVVVVPLVVPFGIVVVIVWPWSICDPPDKQWLIGVAGGAPSSSVCHCKVLLPGRSVALALPAIVRALWVCVVVVSCFVVITSIFHPSSTPQAVAHGAGGRWCVWRRHFVVVVGSRGCSLLSSVPTIIHSPYSTCKQVLVVLGMGNRSAHVRGLLCAYQAGISLPGSPGVPLHPPIQYQQPHILLNREEGDWATVHVCCAFFVIVGH
jgi:hypothetical protein